MTNNNSNGNHSQIVKNSTTPQQKNRNVIFEQMIICNMIISESTYFRDF